MAAAVKAHRGDLHGLSGGLVVNRGSSVENLGLGGSP